jgi:hypothetical protein
MLIFRPATFGHDERRVDEPFFFIQCTSVAKLFKNPAQNLVAAPSLEAPMHRVAPRSRGLAVGIDEFAGYLAVGFTTFLATFIAQRYDLQPQPFCGSASSIRLTPRCGACCKR